MSDKRRGFALIDETARREMARKGGQVAHQRGSAHEWTSEEAREAGRKGGGVLLRSGDDGRTSGLRGAAEALGDVADALERLSGGSCATNTTEIRAIRESIAHASDAVDRIESRRPHLVEGRQTRPRS